MTASPSSPRSRLRRRLILMLLAVAVLFALPIGFNTFKGIMMAKFMQSMANPPQTVSTMQAAYQSWQPQLQAVGNVRAVRGADLAFDVSGLVERVAVQSGADVKKGQVLIVLDDAVDRARLAALRAEAQLAEATGTRARQQLEVKAISRAQYDDAMAKRKAAQANAAAQGALAAKKTLRAPFDGRIGIIKASPGDFIDAGTAVVTLQQLDPVYVDFHLAQSALASLHTGGAVQVGVDGFADKVFAGQVTAISPKIDLETRNIAAQATLANPDKLLLPGMFAHVAVANGAPQRHLTLPQTAVAYAPYGDTVFVVQQGAPVAAAESDAAPQRGRDDPAAVASASPSGSTAQRFVKQVLVTLGPRRGDQVAILDGIAAGDVVVTSGQLKLKNGTPVNIDNSVQPAFDPNPHPVEGQASEPRN